MRLHFTAFAITVLTLKEVTSQSTSICPQQEVATIVTVTTTESYVETLVQLLPTTITVTKTAVLPGESATPSGYPIFIYLPMSSTPVEATTSINSTPVPTFTAVTLAHTSTSQTPTRPGLGGWNSTATAEATILPTIGTASVASLRLGRSHLYGRAAQSSNDDDTGDSVEDAIDEPLSYRLPLPVSQAPSFVSSPLYPTSIRTTSVCLSGSCPSTTEEPTFTIETINPSPPTPAGTGSLPSSTDCGEVGDFTLGWDDLPEFVTNTTDITQAVPIFSPYHHFSFSQGYVYAPLPKTPFRAVSPPHLAVFITNGTGATDVPGSGSIRPGEIGAGYRISQSIFWFNAYSAYLGCDYPNPRGCDYEVSGYIYDAVTQTEVLAYQTNLTTSGCVDLSDCQLNFVNFPSELVVLSGLQIRAFAEDAQRIWFMDELSLGWYDNSCRAGLLRSSVRK